MHRNWHLLLLEGSPQIRKTNMFENQARSHNEANEAVASPKISKKNLPQMKNS